MQPLHARRCLEMDHFSRSICSSCSRRGFGVKSWKKVDTRLNVMMVSNWRYEIMLRRISAGRVVNVAWAGEDIVKLS